MSAAPATTAAPARNAYIDVLRGWSIFGVVCVHFAGSFVTTDRHAWSPSFYLGLGLNQFFSFAVPLFVFLSGVLAGLSRSSAGLGDYYRARFQRIAVPYLFVSFVAFFLLNHYTTWQALPGPGAKFTWLWQHVAFYGVEPTLYFIPLILQLYLLQPLLKALPGWLNRTLPAVKSAHWALGLAVLLLVLHVTLGALCDRGRLNYYVWGRPNALFWMFYFFAGLHFPALAGLLSTRTLKIVTFAAFAVAGAAMLWNGIHLTDRTAMGASFELNRLDFAYVRPELMVYDLAMVLALAAGITLQWSPRAGAASWFGRYSLEIYLWHILVLYYGAWRYPDALAACREVPDLILVICLGAVVAIAAMATGWSWIRAYLSHHRLIIVKVD